MKRVLVDFKGSVAAIVSPGEEHEIFEGPGAAIRWVNCESDEVNPSWILVDGEWMRDVQAPPSYAMLRKQAYGDVGDQMDMLYKDMLNGTSNWIDHVNTVKATVPGPNSDEAREMNAARPPIKWCSLESPAWTDINNREIPGLLHVVGLKETVEIVTNQ